MTETIDLGTLKALGGKEWQSGDRHRVYFNNLAGWYGLRVSEYNSGNISSATLWGSPCSHRQANAIWGRLLPAKVYFDVPTGAFYGQQISKDDLNEIVKAIRKAVKVQAAEQAQAVAQAE